MKKQRNELYRERDALFLTIESLKTAEERKESAFRQLDLDDQIAEIWEKIDYFTKNNQLMPVAVESWENLELPEADVDRLQMLLNDQNYLRRFKHETSKAEEVAKRRKRIEVVKKLLGKP